MRDREIYPTFFKQIVSRQISSSLFNIYVIYTVFCFFLATEEIRLYSGCLRIIIKLFEKKLTYTVFNALATTVQL